MTLNLKVSRVTLDSKGGIEGAISEMEQPAMAAQFRHRKCTARPRSSQLAASPPDLDLLQSGGESDG